MRCQSMKNDFPGLHFVLRLSLESILLTHCSDFKSVQVGPKHYYIQLFFVKKLILHNVHMYSFVFQIGLFTLIVVEIDKGYADSS